MQKVRGHPEGLPLFVSMRFQGLFHSPLGVLFTFPARYLFTIGQQGVLSLGGWSPQIPPGFHVSEGTQELHRGVCAFVYGGLTLFAAPSQMLPLARPLSRLGPTTPPQKPGTVWAIPRSLAATHGVSVDFLSYGYLDVSVPRVGFPFGMTWSPMPGFPIRTSPVHRVLARSPRLFAGSYVLHRLLLPRHPPHALSSLNFTDFVRSSNSRREAFPSAANRIRGGTPRECPSEDELPSTWHLPDLVYAMSKEQKARSLKFEQKRMYRRRLPGCRAYRSRTKRLLKEVIQPQVPLRLPCYDFTPVANLAVDAPLHKWLGSRLRARSTPVV